MAYPSRRQIPPSGYADLNRRDAFNLRPQHRVRLFGPRHIAIAIGDNSYASAQNGMFDFAFADGTNSFAEAEIGNFDVAVADGTDSVAKAGEYAELIPGWLSPTNFDTALVFGDHSYAEAGFLGIDDAGSFAQAISTSPLSSATTWVA